MLYKLGISGKEVLEDRTYRARIIQSGLQRVNGNHITDVEWEGSYGGGSTFEIDGDKIDAGIGIEPYKYVADTKPEDLLPYLQTQLPPKFLKQEWPWLEPGAVYQGGRAGQGNYYICVLENGRDCLIGSQGSVYMTLLSMAFETGYKDERCLQFLGSRDRHVWVYSNKGNIMDHHMSQHHLPGGKPFSLTTEYDFVADELKKKYGFWSHPKKE